MQANKRIGRGKEIVVEDDEIDRFSDLPENILDEIFKDASFHELTRTSVLSKKWRHFWTTHPTLVLDGKFFEEIICNMRMIGYGFTNVVDKILLRHAGSIVKFLLDLSIIPFHDGDLNRWLLYVTRKGVKEVTLDNSNRHPYKLPDCIFNCSALTYLSVTNCIVRPPYPIALFPNLLEIHFKSINFGPATRSHLFNTPLLSTLTFRSCHGIHLLNITAPRVEFLTIIDSHEIRVNFFMNFPNVKVLCISILFMESTDYARGRFITWSRLLALYSNLLGLVLCNSCNRVLGTEIIPKRFEATAHHLEHVKLGVEFGDLDQVSGVLALIRSSPNLRILEIHAFSNMSERSIEEVKRYLTDPNCVDQQLGNLEYLKLTGFEGSPCELIFLELILARSPSLSTIIVAPSSGVEGELWSLSEELMRSFPALSPTLERIFAAPVV